MSQMKHQITATFEGRYLQVLVARDRDFEYSTELWSEVAKACREHKCFAVLLIADTTTPIPVMDGINLGQLFLESGITGEYQFAWVELNENAFEAIRFLETVLINRYFNVQLFSNEADAKQWLLDGHNK